MSNLDQQKGRISPEKRALLEAQLLGKLSTMRKGAVQAAPAEGPQPLSFSQESLWFMDQLKPNSSVYNIAQAFRLRGELRADLLLKSFYAVVQRHPALRTNFLTLNDKPVQQVRPHPSFVLKQVDGPLSETEWKEAVTREVRRPFNLTDDLPIRVTLLAVAPQEHVIVVVLHHIVSDFSSLVVLYREVAQAYQALCEGKDATFPPVRLSFLDWTANQRSHACGERWEKDLSHWKQKLSGELPVLELPWDRSRPVQQSFNGAIKEIHFSTALLHSLKDLSQRQNVTLYTTLLAACQALLHRYTGQDDLVIGSPIDQRSENAAAEDLIGFCINTIPLRTDLSGDPTFCELLQRARAVSLEALVHQQVPFEKIVEALQVHRTADRNPIFQTVFQFLPCWPSLELPGLVTNLIPTDTGAAKFDLTFTLAEAKDGLRGDIEYSVDLIDPATIDRMVKHYETILRSIIANPQEKISNLAILSGEEHAKVVTGWNCTTTEYPRENCIQQLFEAQVALTPDALAVKFEDEHLSYRQLNERANRLAHHLRKQGVGPDTLVGLHIERSLEMIIGTLGILKAGGAYVPFDPNYPVERTEYMLKDTNVQVMLTTRKLAESVKKVPTVLCLDEADFANESSENLAISTNPSHLAYVMYTSGSTGAPKGVLVPHRAVVRLVKETNYARLGVDEVFLQFAPISFDASTLEIWGPLLNGGKLVVFPAQFSSLEALGEVLQREKITTLWLTAGLFHQMVEHHIDSLRGVRQLLAGGDVLSVPHVLKAVRELPDCQLINGYGPTENTTFTCCFAVPRQWRGESSLPIGKPISNTQVYVLDKHLKPVPVGVPGELYIGGDGLARAYLNGPELTQQKFVANPFASEPGAKLYKTGDRVRWLADGNIEFLGRFDNQVKVRGFRVELGEIEAALAQHPELHETTVIARNNSIGKELVAYAVVKPGSKIVASQLRSFLETKLPAFMVPAHFVLMDQFPLNANGKIDRRRLPAPEESKTLAEHIAPRNELEQKLHEIWCEVLSRKQISVEDNFFELGGHSLMATQIASRVNRTFSVDLPLRMIFEHPTIASFAAMIPCYRGAAASTSGGPIRRRNRVEAARLDQFSEQSNPPASGPSKTAQ